MLRSATVAGGLAVVLMAVLAALWSAATHQWAVVTAPGPASLDETLTLLAAAAALCLATWLGLSTLASVAAQLPGRVGDVGARLASACAPAFTRRVATALVGAALGGAFAPGTAVGEPPTAPTSGTAAQAITGSSPVAATGPEFHAAAVGPGFHATAVGADGSVATGAPGVPEPRRAMEASTRHTEPAPVPGWVPGWVPQRPTQRPQASPHLVTTTPDHGAAEIVVRRGDTLWDIVARRLGPEASDAEVAAACPRWHEANREVVGPDPDLILPGQILRAPAPSTVAGG